MQINVFGPTTMSLVPVEQVCTFRHADEFVRELVAELLALIAMSNVPSDFKVSVSGNGRTKTFVMSSRDEADVSYTDEQAAFCLARGGTLRQLEATLTDGPGASADTAIDLTDE